MESGVTNFLPVCADVMQGGQCGAFADREVVGGLGPDEGLRPSVVEHEVVVDCDLKVFDAGVAATMDALRGALLKNFADLPPRSSLVRNEGPWGLMVVAFGLGKRARGGAIR